MSRLHPKEASDEQLLGHIKYCLDRRVKGCPAPGELSYPQKQMMSHILHEIANRLDVLKGMATSRTRSPTERCKHGRLTEEHCNHCSPSLLGDRFNTRTPDAGPQDVREAFEAEFRKLHGNNRRAALNDSGEYSTLYARQLWKFWQAASAETQRLKNSGLPICPAVGDGRIWNGGKWLETCPSMETYAMLNMEKEMERLKAENAKLREALYKVEHDLAVPTYLRVLATEALATKE